MRLRRTREQDPETIRALAAVDAAIAGDRVDPADGELRDLVLALRDERPRPRPEFELALDLRAREGFRRGDDGGLDTAAPARRREPQGLRRLRAAPLALGSAAALFIVATAVLTSGVLGGGGDESSTIGTPRLAQSDDTAGSGATRLEAAPATEPDGPVAGGGTAAPALSPPPASGVAPRVKQRQIERAAELTLAAPRPEIEDVADGVIRVTDRHGGFVLSSSVSSGDRGDAGASLELRIPTPRLAAAVADLSELGHVRSRTQSARDVTAEFSSPRRRLADALAERRGLLRQLASADTANETAAVKARLRSVNRRADRARRELRGLRERVSFAAVSVTVEPGAPASKHDGGWSLGDAARDAVDVLGVVAGATIVALAVALPAGILAGLAWLVYGAVRRRRRERVLDAAPPAPVSAPD